MNYPFDCISDFIFVDTEIEKSDVILVPGGSHPQLMERAAELYKNGYGRYILPSGGANKKLKNNETEWDFLRAIAIKAGVDEKVILKENKAQNTFENARFSWDLLQSMNIPVKNVLLVCKAYHSRRALLTYQSVFPLSINFYVSTVIDNRGISKDNWFLNEVGVNMVMNETVKIGRYFEDKIKNWIPTLG